MTEVCALLSATLDTVKLVHCCGRFDLISSVSFSTAIHLKKKKTLNKRNSMSEKLHYPMWEKLVQNHVGTL